MFFTLSNLYYSHKSPKQKCVLKLQLAVIVKCSCTDSEREKILAAMTLFSMSPGRITEIRKNHPVMWVVVFCCFFHTSFCCSPVTWVLLQWSPWGLTRNDLMIWYVTWLTDRCDSVTKTQWWHMKHDQRGYSRHCALIPIHFHLKKRSVKAIPSSMCSLSPVKLAACWSCTRFLQIKTICGILRGC